MDVSILAMKLGPDATVTCMYNSAKEYALGLRGSEKWLTKGVQEVRSVLGYSGAFSAMRKLHLIVLCGFEIERVDGVILALEPNVVSLGYGDPLSSMNRDHYEVNKSFHEKLVEKYRGVLQFTFACDDADATKEAIERQIKQSGNHNVVIAPLNTKISTVGAALAALENETLQLCYATVDQYNDENYSVASDDCYIFEVPLRIPCEEAA